MKKVLSLVVLLLLVEKACSFAGAYQGSRLSLTYDEMDGSDGVWGTREDRQRLKNEKQQQRRKQKKSDRRMILQQNQEIMSFDAGDWQGLVLYANSTHETFDHVNWATVLSKLGKIRGESDKIVADETFGLVLSKFEYKVERDGLEWIGARQVAAAAYALACLGLHDSPFFDAVADVDNAAYIQNRSSNQQKKKVKHAMKMAGRPNFEFPTYSDLVDSSEGAGEEVQITGGSPRVGFCDKKNILTHMKQTKKLGELARVGDWRTMLKFANSTTTFSNENFTQLWSKLAKLAKGKVLLQDPLFSTMLRRFDDKLKEKGLEWLGLRQLSLNIEGLAAIGASSELFEMIEGGGQRIVEDGEPQEIVLIAVALAKCDIAAPRFFELMNSQRVAQTIAASGPEYVASMLWAAATLGQPASELVRVVDQDPKKILNGKAADAAKCIWAIATLGYDAPSFFAALNTRKVCEKITRSEGSSVATIAFALTNVEYDSATFFKNVQRNARTIAASCSADDVAKCLTSLTHFIDANDDYNDAAKILWDEAMGRPMSEFSEEAWRQLEKARQIFADGLVV